HPPRPLPPCRRHLRPEEPRLAPLPLAVRPQTQARDVSGEAGAAHLAGRRGGAPALSAHALAAAEGGGPGAVPPRRGDGARRGDGRRRAVGQAPSPPPSHLDRLSRRVTDTPLAAVVQLTSTSDLVANWESASALIRQAA